MIRECIYVPLGLHIGLLVLMLGLSGWKVLAKGSQPPGRTSMHGCSELAYGIEDTPHRFKLFQSGNRCKTICCNRDGVYILFSEVSDNDIHSTSNSLYYIFLFKKGQTHHLNYPECKFRANPSNRIPSRRFWTG